MELGIPGLRAGASTNAPAVEEPVGSAAGLPQLREWHQSLTALRPRQLCNSLFCRAVPSVSQDINRCRMGSCGSPGISGCTSALWNALHKAEVRAVAIHMRQMLGRSGCHLQ